MHEDEFEDFRDDTESQLQLAYEPRTPVRPLDNGHPAQSGRIVRALYDPERAVFYEILWTSYILGEFTGYAYHHELEVAYA